jgi:hypothetical protein
LLQQKIVPGAAVFEAERFADGVSVLVNNDPFVAPLGDVDPDDKHNAHLPF